MPTPQSFLPHTAALRWFPGPARGAPLPSIEDGSLVLVEMQREGIGPTYELTKFNVDGDGQPEWLDPVTYYPSVELVWDKVSWWAIMPLPQDKPSAGTPEKLCEVQDLISRGIAYQVAAGKSLPAINRAFGEYLLNKVPGAAIPSRALDIGLPLAVRIVSLAEVSEEAMIGAVRALNLRMPRSLSPAHWMRVGAPIFLGANPYLLPLRSVPRK